MRRLALIALLACFATPIPGQQQETRLRVDVRLVLLNTQVTQPDGRPALDLKREDFRVLEDNVAQPVSVFAPLEAPAHIALVVDTSESTRPYLGTLKKAALDFVEQFRPDDRLAVYDVGPEVVRVAGFTTDHEAVKRVLGQLQTVSGRRSASLRIPTAVRIGAPTGRGDTMLYDGLGLIATEFPADAQRRAILVFTDAIDTGSRTRFEDYANEALKGSTTLYAVLPQQPPAEKPLREPLKLQTFPGSSSWMIVANLADSSKQARQRTLELARSLLDELPPQARVWLYFYTDRPRLLASPPPGAGGARADAPRPLTPQEAKLALDHPDEWASPPGKQIRGVDAERVAVLTDWRSPALDRIYQDMQLYWTEFARLAAEMLNHPDDREEVLHTLVYERNGVRRAEALELEKFTERMISNFKELVSDSGGIALTVRRPADLQSSYAQIAQLIRSSYTLGYYTKAKPGRHELRVETPGKVLTVSSRRVLVVEE